MNTKEQKKLEELKKLIIKCSHKLGKQMTRKGVSETFGDKEDREIEDAVRSIINDSGLSMACKTEARQMFDSWHTLLNNITCGRK